MLPPALAEKAMEFGASRAKIIPVKDIATLNKINCGKCPQFGKNLSCPPLITPPVELPSKLSIYESALLFQVDGPGLQASQNTSDLFFHSTKLHLMVLDLEEYFKAMGLLSVTGLISGCCRLCEQCAGPGNQCSHPSRARSSMEAVGIDVVSTCGRAGWPIKFPANETVKWTGMILGRKI